MQICLFGPCCRRKLLISWNLTGSIPGKKILASWESQLSFEAIKYSSIEFLGVYQDSFAWFLLCEQIIIIKESSHLQRLELQSQNSEKIGEFKVWEDRPKSLSKYSIVTEQCLGVLDNRLMWMMLNTAYYLLHACKLEAGHGSKKKITGSLKNTPDERSGRRLIGGP